MLINVDEEQNQMVEELLDEGISTLKNNIIGDNLIKENKSEKENHIFFENNKKTYSSKREEKINNRECEQNKFISYIGQTNELINKTIEALNTGLHYNQYNKNKEITSNNSKNNYKNNIGLLAKKAQTNLKRRNKNIHISNNIVNNSKNKIKNKLINIKNSKQNLNIKKRNNNTLTIERNNSGKNYSSLINNISTNDNSFKNRNTNEINSKNLLYKNCFKLNKRKKFRNSTHNKILKKENSKIKNINWKEKYDVISTENNNIMKQINNVKNENKIVKDRLTQTINKSNGMEQIKRKRKKSKKKKKKLKNTYTLGENIRLKQTNLIEKISNEIDNLKVISLDY